MRKLLAALLLAAASPAGAGLAQTGEGYLQKKRAGCEQAPRTDRNWEQLPQGTVYFDYELCPPGLEPAAPLVMILLTTHGDVVSVEKWAQGRDGADFVAFYRGKKVAFTLYRDLAAVPAKVFKPERRSGVPAETAARPFLVDGAKLIPFENLTEESAERVAKVLEGADTLVKRAQAKVSLIREAERLRLIVDLLDRPPRARS